MPCHPYYNDVTYIIILVYSSFYVTVILLLAPEFLWTSTVSFFKEKPLLKSYIIRTNIPFSILTYNQGQKLYGQLRKTVLSLTPQAMYNQFKRPCQVQDNFIIYLLRLRILGLMSHVTIITSMAT